MSQVADEIQKSTANVTPADELIQELPFRWNVQGMIFLIGGLAYMFDAWDVLLPAYLFPLLGRSAWQLDATQLGWIGSSGLVGMALGAFIWGTLADMIGRQRSFLWTLVIYGVSSFISAFSPNFEFLVVARFVTGIGLGGCIPVAYSLVAEFMPRARRGMFLTAMDIWWPIGGTLNGLFAIVLLPYNSWRLLLVVMGLPSLLVFWAVRAIPESPLYLMRQGRKAEARKVIEDLIRKTGAVVGTWDLPDYVPTAPSFKQFFGGFGRIWAWNWRITLAVWGMLIANMLLYFGVITWLPQILVSSGYGIYQAYLFTTMVTAIGIAGTLLAAWLVEKIGRKWVIIVPGILAGLAIIVFTLTIAEPSTARWWLLLFGFVAELVIPAAYCYAPEVYPTLLRGTGFGWASTASRLAAGMVPVVFGAWLWPVLGLTNTFIAITALVVVSSIWLAIAGPETMGKSLE